MLWLAEEEAPLAVVDVDSVRWLDAAAAATFSLFSFFCRVQQKKTERKQLHGCLLLLLIVAAEGTFFFFFLTAWLAIES
jgi:hypothetical protein